MPPTGSGDRLTVTLFLAGLFHLILILGISFAPPSADSGDVPTLEVLLVNNSLPDTSTNEQRELPRRAHPAGQRQLARRPDPPALRGRRRGNYGGRSRGRRATAGARGQAGGDGELLSGRGGSTQFFAESADADAAPATLPRESFAGHAFPSRATTRTPSSRSRARRGVSSSSRRTPARPRSRSTSIPGSAGSSRPAPSTFRTPRDAASSPATP